MLVNSSLLRLTVKMILAAAELAEAPKLGKLKREAAFEADLIVMAMLARILHARVFHKKDVQVMEIGPDDVRRPTQQECKPEWLVKSSTSQLVYQLCFDAGLSPKVVNVDMSASGERTLIKFAIVIPTPTRS